MVNYTDVSEPYTRIIEHKHFDVDNVEVQRKPITIITKEFPKSSTGKNPYYPVNDRRNQSLYMEYKSIAQKHPNVLFAGRLGQYKYMNMDEVIYNSIKLDEKELNK